MKEINGKNLVGIKYHTTPLIGADLDHLNSVEKHEREKKYGFIFTELPDKKIVAGKDIKIIIHFKVGKIGFKNKSELGLVWKMPEDWGEPQFDDPSKVNYFSTESSNGSKLKLQFSHRAGPAPWGHLLTIRNEGKDLVKGEKIKLFCGGKNKTTPGWESQTSINPKQNFTILYRSEKKSSWLRIADLPRLMIFSGKATKMSVISASQAVLNKPLYFIIRMIDVWGNPSQGYEGKFKIKNEKINISRINRESLDGNIIDVWRAELTFHQAGIHKIRVVAGNGDFDVESNPIVCRENTPGDSVFWGDLHSGQCNLGCGQGELDRYFLFARKIAGIQFISHQANDVYVTKYDWEHIREVTKKHDLCDDFIVFLGCEWTAIKEKGGDHNIFYFNDQTVLNRASKWFNGPFDDWPEAPTANDLYKKLESVKALINLHVGGFTSNLNFHNPELEKMIEIHSTHATSRWFVEEGFKRNYQLGITAGSDGVSGRPGLEHPGRKQTRNLTNGITAVIAKSFEKNDIWDALTNRHCYATTGERILVDFKLDNKIMGDIFSYTGKRLFHLKIVGTAPIEKILLKRKEKIIGEKIISSFSSEHSNRYRILWGGCTKKGTSRHQKLPWDGHLKTSSGRLELIKLINFYEPQDKMVKKGNNSLFWECSTAGNEAGIIFNWIREKSSKLEFNSLPYNQFFEFSEIEKGVKIIIPGIEDGTLQIEKAPSEEGTFEVELDFVDEEFINGTFPYWVEVIQVDRARAWSSPMYINLKH